MQIKHIVAKLVVEQGPYPEKEIAFHKNYAENHDYTWLGLKKGLKEEICVNYSELYAVSFVGEEDEWIKGTIIGFQEIPPLDNDIFNFYGEYVLVMNTWWKLSDISYQKGKFENCMLVHHKSYDLIGREYFRNQLSLVYVIKS